MISIVSAQDLLITGRTLNAETSAPLAGFWIETQSENDTLTQLFFDENGAFATKVDFDKVVFLSFGSDSTQTKIIEVDTYNVPEEDKTFGFEFGTVTINLLPLVDKQTAKADTVARIYFDPEEYFTVELK